MSSSSGHFKVCRRGIAASRVPNEPRNRSQLRSVTWSTNRDKGVRQLIGVFHYTY